jgi:hypothetical protein
MAESGAMQPVCDRGGRKGKPLSRTAIPRGNLGLGRVRDFADRCHGICSMVLDIPWNRRLHMHGRDMTIPAVILSLAILVGTSVVARSQANVANGPAVVAPVHPGTALLDSMGIYAGAPTPAGGSVHPGTAILDSMGIYAGAPNPLAAVAGNAAAAGKVKPN